MWVSKWWTNFNFSTIPSYTLACILMFILSVFHCKCISINMICICFYRLRTELKWFSVALSECQRCGLRSLFDPGTFRQLFELCGKQILIFQIYKTNETKANKLSNKKGFWQECFCCTVASFLAVVPAVELTHARAFKCHLALRHTHTPTHVWDNGCLQIYTLLRLWCHSLHFWTLTRWRVLCSYISVRHPWATRETERLVGSIRQNSGTVKGFRCDTVLTVCLSSLHSSVFHHSFISSLSFHLQCCSAMCPSPLKLTPSLYFQFSVFFSSLQRWHLFLSITSDWICPLHPHTFINDDFSLFKTFQIWHSMSESNQTTQNWQTDWWMKKRQVRQTNGQNSQQ